MKVCVLQPYYSMIKEDEARCFDGLLDLLYQCDESLDLIVLPEYSDVLYAAADKPAFDASVRKYNARILKEAKEAAVRCSAIVFVNAAFETEKGFRNTTYAIDRSGKIVGKYFKAHPAPSEVKREENGGMGLDVDYSFASEEPYVVEIEGLRFGFMTCYDFYFYEAFAALARQHVNVIIGTSHQRTDTHQALDIIGRFLAYNTNAYLIRSSVSLGADSPVCGSSMIVSPDGTILCEMENDVGLGIAEIDPLEGYLKPAGFHGDMKPHYQYIEEGRRPWLYRPAGPFIGLSEKDLPYPRLASFGGETEILPENSPEAFGAAVSGGAKEIAFETEKADVEKLLHEFTSRTVINMILPAHFSEGAILELTELIRRFDCERYVYFTASNPAILTRLKKLVPSYPRAVLSPKDEATELLLQKAVIFSCEKAEVSASDPLLAEKIEMLHAAGLRVNVRAENGISEKACFEAGADTVLTKCFLRSNKK